MCVCECVRVCVSVCVRARAHAHTFYMSESTLQEWALSFVEFIIMDLLHSMLTGDVCIVFLKQVFNFK